MLLMKISIMHIIIFDSTSAEHHKQETFEGENFDEFCGSDAIRVAHFGLLHILPGLWWIHESFLHEPSKFY